MNNDYWNFINAIGVDEIKYLHLYSVYDDINTCPTMARYIKTHVSFNDKIIRMPSNLLLISFGDHFNQEISYWPQTITHIQFGLHYDNMIYNLPNSLVEIKMYVKYKYLNDIGQMIGK
jgi:hypothetical protein